MRWRKRPPEREPDDSFPRALDAALRLLSYRARSVNEVRQRLHGRFTYGAVEKTLSYLQESGYLDDAAFAREWRASRERRRPRGEAVVRRELLGLGVASGVVSDALEGFDDAALAYRAGHKLARNLPLDDYHKFRRLLWARLQRRGFRTGAVSEAVTRIWRELTELAHGDPHAHGQEQQRP